MDSSYLIIYFFIDRAQRESLIKWHPNLEGVGTKRGSLLPGILLTRTGRVLRGQASRKPRRKQKRMPGLTIHLGQTLAVEAKYQYISFEYILSYGQWHCGKKGAWIRARQLLRQQRADEIDPNKKRQWRTFRVPSDKNLQRNKQGGERLHAPILVHVMTLEATLNLGIAHFTLNFSANLLFPAVVSMENRKAAILAPRWEQLELLDDPSLPRT
ncbi:hypothetical protein QBC37DRAFT_11851 [Rhypophila decipiens]|uniref:Uncharacterized protein n=1 Tax=Rhypophila decipiens TaxID=261697 RepID=A0AAN6Y7G1_9PEZI|nr:hypothetical protein QBC37DRAFT_11851 [Rhypophila decipiens]